MKGLIGVLLIIGGVALGVYVGIWVCFVGGIVDVIQQIRADHLQATSVAWGVAKVLFAGFFGWVSAAFLALPGWAMLQD